MSPSCEKEDVPVSSSINNDKYVDGTLGVSYVTDPENMEPVTTIATFKPKSHLSKGRFGDIPWLELGYATYVDDTSIKYQTMKVYRRSDTLKYFYVMLTNLNIPDLAVSYSYANDKSNDDLYGRLYTRDGADKYASKVKMTLPVHRPGKPVRDGYVYGRLMTKEDLCDILEIDSFDDKATYDLSPSYLERAWDMYYDAFVFGIDDDASEAASFHTLAGWKNSTSIYDPRLNLTPEIFHEMEIAFEAGYYSQKNHKGMYWMNYVNSNDASDVLVIYRHNYWDDDDLWRVAVGPFANHSYDWYGFSVRYVFDPFLY